MSCKKSEKLINSLLAEIEARDPETKSHGERVSYLAVKLGTLMGLNNRQLESLKLGALLHDIGKIGIPDTILLKQGSLTTEERLEMSTHTEIGCEILKDISFLADSLVVVKHHHEHWDGIGGYPTGLRGEAIPLISRIVSVCDGWDACRSSRPYKNAFLYEEAMQEIIDRRGTFYDPMVVDKFIKMMDLEDPLLSRVTT